MRKMDAAHVLALSRSATDSANGSITGSTSVSQSASMLGGILSPSMGASNGLVAVLRMLKLVDKASGLSLFSTQWKWHPHAHAEGVDALVQSLAQFAREIDGGDVVRVHFDARVSRGTSNSIGSGNGITTSNSGSLTPTHPKASEDERRPSSVGDPSSGSSALEMLSHHSGPIQAVLFHDRVSEATIQRLRLFVEQVVDRFLQLYQRELARLTPATAAHQAALTAEETAELVAPFASFADVFENELVTTL